MSPTRDEQVRRASQARRAQGKEDVRKAILQAAAEVLLENGYDGFSLRQVSGRIGYTATTIYLYFKDKEDLVATLVRERWEGFHRQMADVAVRQADPLQRLEALLRTYFAFGLSDPVFYRSVMVQRPDLFAAVLGTEAVAGPKLLARQALTEAMAAGSIVRGDADAVVFMLWGAIHGVLALILSLPGSTAEWAEQLVDTAITTLMKGIR